MKTILTLLCLISFVSLSFSQANRAAKPVVTISPFEYNTRGDNYPSAVSQNGKQIYFTSESGSQQVVAFSDMKNSRWQSPDELESAVNSGKQNGSAALTPDGQFMVFASYKHDVSGMGRTDLYSARKVNGKWSDIQNLGSNINTEHFDSQPTLSSDGNTLYFVSDRPGVGGMDIYTSKRVNGNWQKAELVQGVNTANDEATPFICSDNTTLYFASNRPGTMGGFDIYTSRLKGGAFSKPENIGEPINSTSDEYAYIALPNSPVAYFSSDRTGGSGSLDIYKAEPNPEMPNAVVTMKGLVRDAKSNDPLGSNIIITDLKTRKKVADMKSDDITGEYFVTLTAGRSYSVTATKEGYVFYSERIDVPMEEKGHDVEKDIFLSPFANDAETRLLVFFETGKSELNEDSYADLDKAVELLNQNTDIKIRIEGHTDDVGDDNSNMTLSQRRAESVKTYMVKQGADSKRVTTQGYGETRPKLKGTTEEARAQNRRVEMKIVK